MSAITTMLSRGRGTRACVRAAGSGDGCAAGSGDGCATTTMPWCGAGLACRGGYA